MFSVLITYRIDFYMINTLYVRKLLIRNDTIGAADINLSQYFPLYLIDENEVEVLKRKT